MDNNEIFITLQKNVFEYCDKLNDKDFITLVDSFVFYLDSDKIILNQFLDHFETKSNYEKHLIDLKGETYFLKCSGSNLYYLQDLKQCLFIYTYNRFKNDTIRNNNKSKKGI